MNYRYRYTLHNVSMLAKCDPAAGRNLPHNRYRTSRHLFTIDTEYLTLLQLIQNISSRYKWYRTSHPVTTDTEHLILLQLIQNILLHWYRMPNLLQLIQNISSCYSWYRTSHLFTIDSECLTLSSVCNICLCYIL